MGIISHFWFNQNGFCSKGLPALEDVPIAQFQLQIHQIVASFTDWVCLGAMCVFGCKKKSGNLKVQPLKPVETIKLPLKFGHVVGIYWRYVAYLDNITNTGIKLDLGYNHTRISWKIGPGYPAWGIVVEPRLEKWWCSQGTVVHVACKQQAVALKKSVSWKMDPAPKKNAISANRLPHAAEEGFWKTICFCLRIARWSWSSLWLLWQIIS